MSGCRSIGRLGSATSPQTSDSNARARRATDGPSNRAASYSNQPDEPRLRGEGLDLEVEAGPVRRARHPLGRDAGAQVDACGRLGLVGEGGLEQRWPAEVAVHVGVLDDRLERHLGVGVRPLAGGSRARQRGDEAGGVAQIRGDREHVDEEADQRLDLGAATTGVRDADDHLRLAAEPGEQHLESRSATP